MVLEINESLDLSDRRETPFRDTRSLLGLNRTLPLVCALDKIRMAYRPKQKKHRKRQRKT